MILSSCQWENSTDTQIPEISNSQIEDLVNNDLLLYKYTHWDSASISVDNTIKDSTGEYYKITDPDFDTFAEWTAFAEAIYNGDLLEEQTKHINAVILNVDGDAYVIPGSRENPVSQEYTYETVSSEKDKVVIEVSFTSLHEEDYGEPIIYRYEMTATENGWRITGFSKK